MRKMGLFRIVIPALIVLISFSCSKFRRLQKSGDWKLKYNGAMEYYEEGDYYRSIALFEEILPLTRGKPEGEKAQFYYAYAHYKDKQFILSSHYFKSFFETYTRSELALEAQFMYAYSLYQNSPIYNLDQTHTIESIDAFQHFVNRYADNDYVIQANAIIAQLQVKLEKKAYESTKEYHKIGKLKSAIVSIDNFARDYPDSKYNEELKYLEIETSFKLAEQSIPSKQRERFREVITTYEEFVDNYPESGYTQSAQKLYNSSINKLQKFKKIL